MVETDRARLLITDDDKRLRESLRDVFEPHGYYTRLAADGQEAVDIVRTEWIDLALLDMHMPRLNGLETLRQVKRIKAVLPCIIITADTSDELIREARRAQAFTVIAKPLEVQVLLSTVEQAIGDARPA